MNYDSIYSKIYYDLLLADKQFGMETVMTTAFWACPEDFTKKQIREIALQVLDDALNNGVIKMVGEGVYESFLMKENQAQSEAIKTGAAHGWKDDDSLSSDLKTQIFGDQEQISKQ